MMLLTTLPSMLLAFGVGWVWQWTLLCPSRRATTPWLLQAGLAIVLGMGLTGGIALLALLFNAATPLSLLILDLLMLATGVWLGAWRQRRASRPEAAPQAADDTLEPWHSTSRFQKVGALALWTVALAITLPAWISSSRIALNNAHGYQDAINIWNMRARMLYLAEGDWTRIFHVDMPHAEYPILLPSMVARVWHYLGDYSPAGPQLLAVGFTLTTALMLAGLLWKRRGPALAAVGVLILAATPFFWLQGATQYADTPLSLFMLATVGMLMLANDHPQRLGLLIIAGLCAGITINTKNEGIAFVFLLGLALLACHARQPRQAAKTVIPLALAGLPFAIALLVTKLAASQPNDLINSSTTDSLWSKLTDPARHQMIGDLGYKILRQTLPLNAVALLVGYRLFAGRADAPNSPPPWRQPLFMTGVLAVAGLAATDYLIYAGISTSLEWHLGTSLNRLLIQLWPATILLTLWHARSPFECALRTRPQPASDVPA